MFYRHTLTILSSVARMCKILRWTCKDLIRSLAKKWMSYRFVFFFRRRPFCHFQCTCRYRLQQTVVSVKKTRPTFQLSNTTSPHTYFAGIFIHTATFEGAVWNFDDVTDVGNGNLPFYWYQHAVHCSFQNWKSFLPRKMHVGVDVKVYMRDNWHTATVSSVQYGNPVFQ